MWLLLLFAFAPRQGPETLPSGPPAPHLSTDLSAQWRIGAARADWRAFRQRWGGEWAARWDPRDGTPRFLWAPGVPVEDADALAADVALLAGVAADELALTGRAVVGDREILRYTRIWRGAEVEGDQVALVATRGQIGGVWAQLTPLAGVGSPRAGEVVARLPPRYAPALVTKVETAAKVSYRDREGDEIYAFDPRLFATVEVEALERTVGDALQTWPARDVTVRDGSGAVETTDEAGECSLSGALEVWLSGDSLHLTDNRSEVRVSGTDDVVLTGGDDVSYATATVLHHFHVVWDWLGERWPDHTWLEDTVPADVNQLSGTCNAYYSSGTVTFYPESPGRCNNFGQIADVVYHEIGHGIHHYILAAGTFASDISEGSADYVSATILDDPELAPGAYPGGAYIREIDTDKVYPTDVTGESHNDGLIWASFLWDLREQWISTYGEDDGVEMTDLLFLGALSQGPTLTDVYEAVILADDDDGDLSNGTPHACELVELLNEHGLGPGPIGVVVLDHAPLEPQASATEGYEVSFSLYAPTADCAELDEDSVQLWYTADEDAALPDGVDGWAGWEALSLSRTDDTWSGTIPRVPANSRVRYFMMASSLDGTETITSHDDAEDALYQFWVGDRAEIWCDDLESGEGDWEHGAGTPWAPDSTGLYTDEWALGTPDGEGFLPDAPTSGDYAFSTGLAGEYSNNNLQYLQSPTVDVTDPGLMLLLTYRRYLTVEDALYDQATLYVDGAAAWSNLATSGGTTHTLDGDWWLHELPLSEAVSADDSAVQFTWTLQSDAGLEFGGWTVDDVCVVQLDDVPGHYRVDDLAATWGEGLATLRWSQPWIRPLEASVLVAREGDWPTGPEDGHILAVDLTPGWGEEAVVVDEEPIEGEIWYYAVFTAGEPSDDDDGWFSDVVEGENGAVLDLRAPVDTGIDDTGVVDTALPLDSGGEGGEGGEGGDTGPAGGSSIDVKLTPAGGGCGCAAGGSGAGVAWLLGLAGLAWRRRRAP